MHLNSLPVLILALVIACPIVATKASWRTTAAISRAAISFATRSGCEIISKPGVCYAVECFRQGGRCDVLTGSGKDRGRCFPHVMRPNGRLVPQEWGSGTETRECRGCKCKAVPGGRQENEAAKEENRGANDGSHDADFHRFLREVVLRESPAQQAAPSAKRQKVRQS